jgi:hypothetical protein
MPALLEVSSHVMVRAEQERVWQAAVDWPRQREWVRATRVRGGQGTGAEVIARTGIGPIGFTDTMVITEWDPPRRCVVGHTGRVVRGLGVFEVEPHGDQCAFIWTERLELPRLLAGGIGGPVVRRLAQMALDSSLCRFARLFANP